MPSAALRASTRIDQLPAIRNVIVRGSQNNSPLRGRHQRRKSARRRFFLGFTPLLQYGDIRDLQEQLTQLAQQSQAVHAHRFIFCHHHHAVEERIHGFTECGQFYQCFLVAAFGEERLQLMLPAYGNASPLLPAHRSLLAWLGDEPTRPGWYPPRDLLPDTRRGNGPA